MTDFTQALERIIAGLEKRNRLLNPKEREVVAHHEIGHALVALLLPDMDKIHKISIVPRGIGSLGYTIQRPSDEHMLATYEQLENKMAVLLGGRAAEMLTFGQASTGAADDLAKATDIARSMVARFGMTDKIGLASYDQEANHFLSGTSLPMERHRDYSEETSRKIDDGIRESLDRAFAIATQILHRRHGTLNALATLLLKQETLNEQELEEFLRTQPKAA